MKPENIEAFHYGIIRSHNKAFVSCVVAVFITVTFILFSETVFPHTALERMWVSFPFHAEKNILGKMLQISIKCVKHGCVDVKRNRQQTE